MVGSPPEKQLGQARACCVQVLRTEVWAGLLMVWLVHRARPGLLVLALGALLQYPQYPPLPRPHFVSLPTVHLFPQSLLCPPLGTKWALAQPVVCGSCCFPAPFPPARAPSLRLRPRGTYSSWASGYRSPGGSLAGGLFWLCLCLYWLWDPAEPCPFSCKMGTGMHPCLVGLPGLLWSSSEMAQYRA